MQTYEYRPTRMSTIEPSPEYVEPAHKLQKHWYTEKMGKDNLERKRTNIITRRQNESRFIRGRLYSHYKIEQIKEGVKEVRAKALLAAQEEAMKKNRVKKKKEDEVYEVRPVDDTMSLPMGTEFDFVLKAKAEEIDEAKSYNNIKMDELVDMLGYMDYRDALACNKYIIEAKRSQNYH